MNNIIVNDFNSISLLYSSCQKDYSFTWRFIKIQKLFGFNKKIYVKIFSSIEDLELYIGHKLADWVKGIAEYPFILLVHPSGWKQDREDSFSDLFLHEYVHVAVEKSFHHPCPVWLNEGLAVYFSEQYKTMRLDMVDHNYDYYTVNGYQDINYNQFAYAVLRLMSIYGEEHIINRARRCTDFYTDDVFGFENLKNILQEV
jgi:hypothetical protein